MLVQRDLVSQHELTHGESIEPAKSIKRILKGADVEKALLKGAPVERETKRMAQFAVGDVVRINNQHISSHTRMPGYIKGRSGTVHKIHGSHVFADHNAKGLGENPQWLYNIRFNANELWGQPRTQARYVHVDCWEPYLCASEPK